MKIEHILAGIDFDKQTGQILSYASIFAKRFESSLHLLHVIDYLVTPPAYLNAHIREERKAAEEKFEKIKHDISFSGIESDSKVVIGRLQPSFKSTVRKIGADLLVLGFASHALRRSSSEKLIKSLQMPMLVVRGDIPKTVAANIGIKRILCPIDFSNLSKKAFQVSRELADAFSSEIEVAHVIPDSVMKKLPGNKDRVMKEVYERERKRLEDFLSSVSFAKTGIMDQGEPHKRITAFAKEKEIDLIVIGARGLGFINGLLIGSVTNAVLKSSPCPVLVIH